MYRRRSSQLRYDRDRQKDTPQNCQFCNPSKKNFVRELKNFFILKNIYPYDLWDKRRVEAHLMIVPRIHVVGLEDIDEDHLKEYFELLRYYAQLGYDSFTRSSQSPIKTKAHMHTHLIKPKGKIIRIMHFNDDPYFLYFK